MNLRLPRFILVAFVITISFGCGPKFSAEPTVDAYRAKGPGQKVRVEAYLFDAKIRRDGNPTSLRLELFQTDSLVALSARGYLGKGALKGRLTADSLEAYFPTRNEYLHEAVRDLLFSSSCTHTINHLDFPSLLRTLPDEMNLGDARLDRDDQKDGKRPHFVITWPECTWRLELTYNFRKNGWRLLELLFDNGDNISFTARRRVHKASTRVNRNKFDLPVGPNAIRITP